MVGSLFEYLIQQRGPTERLIALAVQIEILPVPKISFFDYCMENLKCFHFFTTVKHRYLFDKLNLCLMTSNSYCVIIKEIQKYAHGDTTLQIFPWLFLYIALDKLYFGAFHIPTNFA